MVKPEPYGDIPTFKSLLTGCDNWVNVLDEYGPYKNDKGVWMKKFLIVPSKHLVKDYPWLMEEGKMSATRYGPAIWVEYPYTLVNDQNTSRTNAIVRVYCSFDGKDTPETERHKYYTERLKDTEKECNHLKESLAYYQEMIKDALGNQINLAKKNAELNEIQKGGKREDGEEEQEIT